MARIGFVPPALGVNILVGPLHSQFADGIASAFPTANAARLFAFQVQRPVTVTTVYFRVVTQSGSADFGIYNDAGTRLASTGSFLIPAPNITCSQALTASVTLVPGLKYWAAMACDNITANVSTYAGAANPSITGYVMSGQVSTAFPLPAPIVIPVAEQGIANAWQAFRFA